MYIQNRLHINARKEEGIMDFNELQLAQVDVVSTKTRVFDFINQCIENIEKTVSTSGLTMRDIGFDVEKYATARDSYIIELKLRI